MQNLIIIYILHYNPQSTLNRCTE